MDMLKTVARSQNDYVKQKKKGTKKKKYELCDAIYIKSNPDQTHSMVFEARRNNCLCRGSDLPSKAFVGIFWGDEMLNMVFWVVVPQKYATVKTHGTEH